MGQTVLLSANLCVTEWPTFGFSHTYGLAKTGLYQGLQMSLEDVLNMEARNQSMAGRTQDRVEGVAAFREKRSPRFIGR
jgi:2-(1,2-epoxy-1,2-dihydrophenyl)acetyl-CoA isomerase